MLENDGECDDQRGILSEGGGATADAMERLIIKLPRVKQKMIVIL